MKISLLKDQASATDAFGGHGWVADTLVKLLRDSADVRFIGLLGAWGSGKSTVVRLAEQELAEETTGPTNIIFTYDAWLHQSDPPRRAFIEAFVSFLVSRGISTSDDWKLELDEVQRRVETHTVESTPTLTPWGTGIIMSLLLLPVGARLTAGSWIAATIGWLLICLPFLIAALNWWCWRPQRNPLKPSFYKRQNLLRHRGENNGKSVLSAFVNRSVDKTTNRIVKTPEPTSIEFRSVFFRIIEAVSSKERRFIFILDNLDRISEDDALTIWSTFRSLFAHSERANNINNSFKVVIPLDFNSLHNLYKKDKSDKDEAVDRVQSLLDKSFDAVLRVGPPVASDWHAYLETGIRRAIDGISDEDAYAARAIYHSAIQSNNRSSLVTPREINSYINAICIILMQRGTGVSMASACYYSCFTNRGDVFKIDDVLSQKPQGFTVINRIDPDWRRDVAAIHFGVPADRALQLLLKDRIISAISEGNTKQFSELEQVRGFDVVLQQLLTEDELKIPRFYANLSAMLSDAALVGPAKTSVRRRLQLAALDFDAWDDLNSLTASGLGKIVRGSNALTARHVLESLAVETALAAVSAEAWIQNAEAVADADPSYLPDRITVPFGAEFYLSAIAAAQKTTVLSKELKRLTTVATPSDLGEQLAELAAADNFASSTLSLIAAMRATGKRCDWQDITTGARERVEGTSRRPALNGLTALLAMPSASAETLDTLGRSGSLAHWFYELWQDEDIDELEIILSSIAIGWPTLPIGSHRGNSAAGYSILSKLDGLSSAETDTLTTALMKAIQLRPPLVVRGLIEFAESHAGSRRVLLKVVRQAFNQNIVSRLYVSDLIDKIKFLYEDGRLDGREIVSSASSYVDFWLHAQQKLDEATFALLIYRVPASRIPEAAELVIANKSKGFSTENWSDQIQSDNPTVKAIARLGSVGKKVNVGNNLASGINKLFDNILDGTTSSLENDIDWAGLLSHLEEEGIQSVAQHLCDRLISADNSGRSRFIENISVGFWKQKQVQKLSDRLVRGLAMPLAASSDKSHLDLIADNAEILSNFVRKARKPIRHELGEILNRQFNNELLSSEGRQKAFAAWNIPSTASAK